MPIKNKDGTTFQLRGPNPTMDEQKLWDSEEVELYNFRWKGVVVHCGHEGKPQAIPKEEREPTVDEELFEPEVVQAPVIQVHEKEPEPDQDVEPYVPISSPEPQHKPVEIVKPKSNGKIRMHCLPAVIADYSDDLYGQKYKTIQYGDKFIADAGIIHQGDIESVFWSNDDRISLGSILYPITMEKRWWKVSGVEERSLGGYILYCQASDRQPRFD